MSWCIYYVSEENFIMKKVINTYVFSKDCSKQSAKLWCTEYISIGHFLPAITSL